jgi:hypothetical protein
MADTATKLTDHTFKIVKTVEETIDYTFLKKRRAALAIELAKVDAQLALGDSVGVVEKLPPVKPV